MTAKSGPHGRLFSTPVLLWRMHHHHHHHDHHHHHHQQQQQQQDGTRSRSIARRLAPYQDVQCERKRSNNERGATARWSAGGRFCGCVVDDDHFCAGRRLGGSRSGAEKRRVCHCWNSRGCGLAQPARRAVAAPGRLHFCARHRLLQQQPPHVARRAVAVQFRWHRDVAVWHSNRPHRGQKSFRWVAHVVHVTLWHGHDVGSARAPAAVAVEVGL